MDNYSARVALLIARAGAKDCLRWWDDDSSTTAGEFVLSRLFPRRWKSISYSLAIKAAKERHEGAARAAGLESIATLFSGIYSPADLEIAAADEIVISPLSSMDEFKARLTVFCPHLEGFDVPLPQDSGLLDLTDIVGNARPVTGGLVAAFAAGYTRAQAGNPVFPFIRRPDDLKR